MKTNLSMERVFEGLAAIRASIDEQLKSLDEQIQRTRLEYLKNSFDEKNEALADCINGIDQQLIKLSVYLDEYRLLYASLHDLHEKISGLGGEAGAMPEGLEGDTLEAILSIRIDRLKPQAKN